MTDPTTEACAPASPIATPPASSEYVHPSCREEGCQTPAVFAVFAFGYPAAQAATCERHLGNWLLRDMSNPGSTNEWTVRVGSWVR